MLLLTLTEEEFRTDKTAVEELATFLASESGQKYAAAMRGGDPMTLLSSPENRQAKHVRDLALAEAGNPHNLLGVCKGYRIGMAFTDILATPLEKRQAPTQGGTHLARVSHILNSGPATTAAAPVTPDEPEVPVSPPAPPKKKRK